MIKLGKTGSEIGELEFVLLEGGRTKGEQGLFNSAYSILKEGIPDPDEREAKRNLEGYLKENSDEKPKAARDEQYLVPGRLWPFQRQTYNVLVGRDAQGQAIGLMIFNFLANENTGNAIGSLDYAVIRKDLRRKGIGAIMVSEFEKALHQMARANGAFEGYWEGAKPVELAAYVLEIESEHPDQEIRRNVIPMRRGFFRQQGLLQIDPAQFKYIQPSLTDGQAPVHNLHLYVQPVSKNPQDFSSQGISRKLLTEILTMITASYGGVEYIDRDFREKDGYKEMAAALGFRYDMATGIYRPNGKSTIAGDFVNLKKDFF